MNLSDIIKFIWENKDLCEIIGCLTVVGCVIIVVIAIHFN